MQRLEPVASALGRRIVVHPGMVRTGTSTLQRHVFARHSGLQFLGLPAPSAGLEWAVAHLCQADSIHLQAARLRDELEAAIAAAAPGRTLLISYENYALYKSKDKGLVANRILALFPNAEIVFTLRRQEDLIVSRYLTDLRQRIKLKSFIAFDDWYWFGFREAYRTIFDDLHYFRLLDYYADLFGRSRVQAILFEELKDDPDAFSDRFAGVLGIDAGEFRALLRGQRENASMSQAYLRFWRDFGHLVPRRIARDLSRKMDRRGGAPARIELTDEMRAHLAGLYGEGNARLADRFGVDIARYGYSLSREGAPPPSQDRVGGTTPP